MIDGWAAVLAIPGGSLLLLFLGLFLGLIETRTSVKRVSDLLTRQIELITAAAKSQVDEARTAARIQVELMNARLADKDVVIASGQAETRAVRAETLAAKVETDLQREQNRELLNQQETILENFENLKAMHSTISAVESAIQVLTARAGARNAAERD